MQEYLKPRTFWYFLTCLLGAIASVSIYEILSGITNTGPAFSLPTYIVFIMFCFSFYMILGSNLLLGYDEDSDIHPLAEISVLVLIDFIITVPVLLVYFLIQLSLDGTIPGDVNKYFFEVFILLVSFTVGYSVFSRRFFFLLTRDL